jgi:hypothetical protein
MVTLAGLRSITQGSKPTRLPDVRWRADFYRHDGSVITTGISTFESNTGRTSNDIIAGTVQKHIGNPIGVWSLQLVPRQEYFSLVPVLDTNFSSSTSQSILPGDWCEIESDNGDGRGWRKLMYGPITDIRRKRNTDARGAVTTTILVSGTDFGKALARISAVQDLTLAQETVLAQASIAAVASGLQAVTGSPAELLQVILSRYLFDLPGQMIDPKTGRTFGAADLELGYLVSANVLGKTLLQPINLGAMLWQLMEQWSNPVINELFCDLRPRYGNQQDLVNLVPAVVLRQYPFFGTDWNNLTAVSVDRTEVINEDIGFSDSDVKNWIRPLDEPQQGQNSKGVIAIYDRVGAFVPDSVKRFGFARNENPTPYIFDPDAEDHPPIRDLIQKICGLMTVWHHSNERLANGTIELYHRPDIRIGYRLDYEDSENEEKVQYYIEGVQHSFNYPGRSSTSLTLTRGRSPQDRRFSADLAQLKADGVVAELGDTISRIASVIT